MRREKEGGDVEAARREVMSGGKCGSHRPTGGSGDLTRGMLTVGVLFATPRNIPAATGCNSSSYTAWV